MCRLLSSVQVCPRSVQGVKCKLQCVCVNGVGGEGGLATALLQIWIVYQHLDGSCLTVWWSRSWCSATSSWEGVVEECVWDLSWGWRPFPACGGVNVHGAGQAAFHSPLCDLQHPLQNPFLCHTAAAMPHRDAGAQDTLYHTPVEGNQDGACFLCTISCL